MPGATTREQIRAVLREGWASARELSGRVGITEREVVAHLPHVERSARAAGELFETEPARCLACDRGFEGRTKKRTPSRCPACRSERIARPRFRVV